jgi:transposase
METPRDHRCPNCVSLEQRIAVLEDRLAALQVQLAASKKNSANSSKPPSSDIIKPPRPGGVGGRKRKRGGQPGHPRHERPPFTPEEIDERVDYTLSICPDCGGRTRLLDLAPRVVQQVEIVRSPITVSEHRGRACFCVRCQKTHYAEIPAAVRRAGLVGPRLTALVAFLKGGCHCSFTTIRKFLRDVVGVTVSRGQLRNVCAKVSDSLDAAYEELLGAARQQAVLNVDETGHKEYAQRLWTWCFRAATFTLFKIDPSRSAQVLVDVLGEEFQGVLGCDYYSAYRKYMGDFNVLVQFCLAHLLRDIRFLVEHPNPQNRAYGRRLLEATRQVFHVIHQRRKYSAANFQVALQNAGDELWAQAVYRVPGTREAQNLARRFEKHGESYLRFITTPGIEPTNNLAEQAIRFVVIDRHVTQGSRSEAGRRWLERIWSTMATCAQQGKSVFEFLVETVQTHFQGQPTPSMLPNTS